MNSKKNNRTEKQTPVELTDAALDAVGGGAGVRNVVIPIPELPLITDNGEDNESKSTRGNT